MSVKPPTPAASAAPAKKEASPRLKRDTTDSAADEASGAAGAADEVYDHSYASADAIKMLGNGTVLIRDVLDRDLFLVHYFHSTVPLGHGENHRTLALWIKIDDKGLTSEMSFNTTTLARSPLFPRNADRMIVALIPKGQRVEYYQAVDGGRASLGAGPMLFVRFHKRWIIRTIELAGSAAAPTEK